MEKINISQIVFTKITISLADMSVTAMYKAGHDSLGEEMMTILTDKVPFIYYVSICLAQNLIWLPNLSQKLGFFRQNKRIYFSTLHFDKIFML